MLQFLYSSIIFLIALFFLIFGSIALLLPQFTAVQDAVIHFITHYNWPWHLFGLALCFIAMALFGHIWHINQRRSLTLRKGVYETTIHEGVVDDYLKSYFSKTFPKQEIPYRFLIKKKKIQISADLPYYPKEEQKDLLEKVHSDLSDLMHNFLGYNQMLDLSLSFAKKK